MESTSAFPREEEEERDEEKPTVVESERRTVEDDHDEKPQVNASSSFATETPFVPPTATEAPFVPPSSSIDDDETTAQPAPASPVPATVSADDKPLTSSTSLKRRSVQAQPSNTSSTGGTGAGGGGAAASGRLRGARAPRPISTSNSSVFDKVKQFEGGN